MSGTQHTVHPDTHTHGLADGCPRCAEHADHPLISLDGENMETLFDRVHEGNPPRSENEALAMSRVEEFIVQAERVAINAPAALVRSLGMVKVVWRI